MPGANCLYPELSALVSCERGRVRRTYYEGCGCGPAGHGRARSRPNQRHLQGRERGIDANLSSGFRDLPDRILRLCTGRGGAWPL